MPSIADHAKTLLLYGHVKPRKTRERFLEFCRYIIWRNTRACDERLRRIVDKANVA